MFTNAKRQEERIGRSGTPRQQYLQDLVAQFQSPTATEESREKIAANLANFAYDPYNYAFLRELNVLELFLDCITEPNERLVEFGVGGVCNAGADPMNARVIAQCGGVPLVVQCLSSPGRDSEGWGGRIDPEVCGFWWGEYAANPRSFELLDV
ncbi:Armadillo repeat-containing protein [Drosera capensis]